MVDIYGSLNWDTSEILKILDESWQLKVLGRFFSKSLPASFDTFDGSADEAFKIFLKACPCLAVPKQAKLACHLISTLIPFLDIDGETFYQTLKRVEPNLVIKENTERIKNEVELLAKMSEVKFEEKEEDMKKLHGKLTMWSKSQLTLYSHVEEKEKKQALSRSIALTFLILMRAVLKPTRKVASLLSSKKNKVNKVSRGLYYPLDCFTTSEIQMMAEAVKSFGSESDIFLTIRCGIAIIENLSVESLPRKMIQFGLMDHFVYHSLTLPNFVEQAASTLQITLEEFLTILDSTDTYKDTVKRLRTFWGDYLKDTSKNVTVKYSKIFSSHAWTTIAVRNNVATIRLCQWIIDKHSKGPTSKHPVWKLQLVVQPSESVDEVAKTNAVYLKKKLLEKESLQD